MDCPNILTGYKRTGIIAELVCLIRTKYEHKIKDQVMNESPEGCEERLKMSVNKEFDAFLQLFADLLPSLKIVQLSAR